LPGRRGYASLNIYALTDMFVKRILPPMRLGVSVYRLRPPRSDR
jgi:hypothetical protein